MPPSEQVTSAARKIPRQRRSRATVAAIHEACAQVLVAEGYEAATTTRVAARAGVSIGSLYQYFPNREALIAALVARQVERTIAACDRALADPRQPLAGGLRSFARMAMDVHRVDPRLHRILVVNCPADVVGELAAGARRHLIEALTACLAARRDELPSSCVPAVAALLIETAFEAIVHARASADGGLWDTFDLEDELTRLALGLATVEAAGQPLSLEPG